jgi:hypothetical protein
LLPWKNNAFENLQTKSPQEIKYTLSQHIQRELFFASFVSVPESTIKYWDKIKLAITKMLMKKRI